MIYGFNDGLTANFGLAEPTSESIDRSVAIAGMKSYGSQPAMALQPTVERTAPVHPATTVLSSTSLPLVPAAAEPQLRILLVDDSADKSPAD